MDPLPKYKFDQPVSPPTRKQIIAVLMDQVETEVRSYKEPDGVIRDRRCQLAITVLQTLLQREQKLSAKKKQKV